MLLSGILLHTEATHRGHFGSVIRRYSCIWLVICAVNYMSLTSLGPWMHQSGCRFAFRSPSLSVIVFSFVCLPMLLSMLLVSQCLSLWLCSQCLSLWLCISLVACVSLNVSLSAVSVSQCFSVSLCGPIVISCLCALLLCSTFSFCIWTSLPVRFLCVFGAPCGSAKFSPSLTQLSAAVNSIVI